MLNCKQKKTKTSNGKHRLMTPRMQCFYRHEWGFRGKQVWQHGSKSLKGNSSTQDKREIVHRSPWFDEDREDYLRIITVCDSYLNVRWPSNTTLEVEVSEIATPRQDGDWVRERWEWQTRRIGCSCCSSTRAEEKRSQILKIGKGASSWKTSELYGKVHHDVLHKVAAWSSSEKPWTWRRRGPKKVYSWPHPKWKQGIMNVFGAL